MHTSTVKPYKPNRKTLQKIESGEFLLKDKYFNMILQNTSPTPRLGKPFKGNVLEEIWNTILPFKTDQMNRMEDKVKVEIKKLALKGINAAFRFKIDHFLGDHAMRYEVYEEKKLEYLLRYQEAPSYYVTKEGEHLLYGFLEELFVSSAERVLFSKYYYGNVEKFDMTNDETYNLLLAFFQKCMILFEDLNVDVKDKLYERWIEHLSFGLNDKHKEFYSLAKFKPYSNYVLWYCIDAKENGLDEDGILFVDYFLNFYKYLDKIKELEPKETIIQVREFVEYAKENVQVEKLYDEHKDMHVELFRLHEQLTFRT